ncbi:MAG: nucleotidyltransferase domain-containing protein [Gammaproteobacteria bacterium]
MAAATSSQVILFGSYARGTADEGSDQREIPNMLLACRSRDASLPIGSAQRCAWPWPPC